MGTRVQGSQGIPNQLKPLSKAILSEQPFPRPESESKNARGFSPFRE